MSKPSFTPGPWRVEHRCVMASKTKVIADVPQWGTKASKADEFNAHLIAAAPDLYAACEAALETMRMQEKREREEFHIPQPTAKAIWDETIGQIEEAIRAAKGEEPKS